MTCKYCGSKSKKKICDNCKRQDITGNAKQLFIIKKTAKGREKGEKYVR